MEKVPKKCSMPVPQGRMIAGLAQSVAACALLVTAVAGAQNGRDDEEDEFFDRAPERCISTNRIRETEVIDDRTILFYLRGRQTYVNMLEHNCAGLENAGRFIMETRGGRLCSVDTVTVLLLAGARGMPGMTCFLGDFYPIPREEAELMELEDNERLRARPNVVITPVESDVIVAEDEVTESGEDAALE
jgi:hypothetical protein